MSIAPRVPVTTGTLPARISATRVLCIRALSSLPLFATMLYFSPFLLFLFEPMVAKLLLPGLGGAPMVWNTCVVFFQLVLLLGYALVHATRRFTWRARAGTLLLLAGVAAFTLPVTVGSRPPSFEHPVLWLFWRLT